MSKFKNVLDGLISAAFKTGGEKVAELLNSDEENLDEKELLSLLLDADKNRIKEIRTKYYDDGHKKGKSESLTSFENDLREKHGITDPEKRGAELIDAILEKTGKASGKELDDEAVKRSKTYQADKLAWEKKIEDLKKEMEQKVSETQAGFQREKLFTKASEQALSILDGLKPILSTDPQKALRQKQIILNELKGYEFDEINGETVIMKDGKAVEDEHGHSVKFDSLVKSISSQYFDFQKAEPRSTPNGEDGGAGAGGQKKTAFTGVLPKNEAEYVAKIADDSVPLAERMALKEAWAASKTSE